MAASSAESEIQSRFSRPIKREKRDDEKAAPANQTIEERLAEMRRAGTLVPSDYPKRPLRLGKPSPGALQRFLADRWGVDVEEVERIQRGE